MTPGQGVPCTITGSLAGSTVSRSPASRSKNGVHEGDEKRKEEDLESRNSLPTTPRSVSQSEHRSKRACITPPWGTTDWPIQDVDARVVVKIWVGQIFVFSKVGISRTICDGNYTVTMLSKYNH